MPALVVELPIEEKYGVPEKDQWELDRDYYASCEKRGFNKAAVVVMKSKANHHFIVANERHWGIIINTRQYRTYATDALENINVFWLSEGKEGWYHADDLILINPAPEFSVLRRQIESQ